MNLKKVAVVVLLTLVMSMTFVVLNPTLAQTNVDDRKKAESLINILNTVKTSTDEAFNRLNAQNLPVPPTAETRYREGLSHAEEAVVFLRAENFSESSSKAVEAMQKFEETLRILQEASPVEPTETQVIAEKTISLKASLSRAFEYVERLENLTVKARKAGYNTKDFEDRISDAKNHLENASEELKKTNLEGTAEELRVARGLLDKLLELLDRMVNLVKISNSEKYLEEAEIRVSTSKENIMLSTKLTPEIKEDAITALNNSENSLENAREFIDKRMVDEAIGELQEAKKWEEESLNYLNSTNVSPNSIETVDDSPKRIDTALST